MTSAIPLHRRLFACVMFALMACLATDVRGATTLIYEVADADAEVDMKELAKTLRKRLDSKGKMKITVRGRGGKQVEIVVPEADEEEIKRLKRKIESPGTLEFRVTASPTGGAIHELVIKAAWLSDDRRVFVDNGKGGGEVLGWWIPVAEGREEDFVKGGYILRTGKENEKDVLEVLVVNDVYNVLGKYIRDARAGTDDYPELSTGKIKMITCHTVHFTFNAEGGKLFGMLTGANLKRQLGIIINGRIYSAPVIQSQIFAEGQISGGFTRQEVEDLAAILNSGSLPAALRSVPAGDE